MIQIFYTFRMGGHLVYCQLHLGAASKYEYQARSLLATAERLSSWSRELLLPLLLLISTPAATGTGVGAAAVVAAVFRLPWFRHLPSTPSSKYLTRLLLLLLLLA